MVTSSLATFWLAFFSITASELFDKTFFIVIILCLTTKSKVQVFLGSYVGLVGMTVLICLMGNCLSQFISRRIFEIISSVLFLGFSLQIFYNLVSMDKSSSCEEAEEEIKKVQVKSRLSIRYPVFFKTLVSTVVSELGDKSQIASFMLSSTYSFPAVLSACLFAYAFCIGLGILIHNIGKTNLKESFIHVISGTYFLFVSLYSFSKLCF